MNEIQNALAPAGPQAAHIAELWWFTLAICAAVFVAVMIAFALALRRAPRASAATPPDLGPLATPERGTRVAVTAAVAASTVGLVVLLAASVLADRALAQLPLHDALGIRVVAHQWWWEVRYDDPDPSRTFTTANEIVIPVGRPVMVTLNSDDVIHSFWVPNLHGKKDLIPGHTTTTQLRADKAGTYRGQCAEFCGLQHAYMAFEVKAVEPPEFTRWADEQRQAAAEPQDAAARRGKELFLSGSCMMCHAIQGTSANARRAPDLTHVGSRRTIAAGRLPNTPERMREWIEDPQKWKPGVNMPAHRVAPADLDALAAYMGSLR